MPPRTSAGFWPSRVATATGGNGRLGGSSRTRSTLRRWPVSWPATRFRGTRPASTARRRNCAWSGYQPGSQIVDRTRVQLDEEYCVFTQVKDIEGAIIGYYWEW
jgi:hypothetical protein